MIAVVTTNALELILTFISRPATRPTAIQKGVRAGAGRAWAFIG